MKPTAPILLALLAAPAAATPPVRDFELPPGPTGTPTTAAPQMQGPVDPEAPAATRLRPVPSPTPRPTVTPSPTSTPVAEPLPTASPRPAPSAPSTAPAATASPAATSPQPDTAASPEPPSPTDSALPPAAPAAQPQAPTASAEANESLSSPGYILGIVAGLVVLIGGLAAGLLWWRRRQPLAARVPQIELPLVIPKDGPEPVSPPASLPLAAPAPMLRIEATPSHLTRSMMAATFSCRVTLMNRGDQPINDVTVGLDLTTAHSSVPTHEQLADPARPLPEVGRFARIAPGETVEFAHDVRLPTAQIRTLRQGEAQLYIPLLRVRVQAGSNGPVARTFLVGTLPDASAKKLQPFRLDEMPQTYRLIGVAALD